MNKLAHFFSFIFSPLLLPTYGVMIAMFCTVLCYAPERVRWSVIGVTFVLTCFVPLLAIGLMLKLGLVSDPGLNKRTERTLPFLITLLSYGACALYLHWVNGPMWLVMFMVGAMVAAIVSAIINRWWKISAHGAGVGGLVAMTFRIWIDGVAAPYVMWLIIGAIMVAGIVGTSRLILQRHTLLQVLAGTANGFLCVFFLSAIH
ncbi:MAG: hypothetical protein LIO90_00455 [Bacteroidales bacterium]|nr:hypothetical protein [Bacteroidales bacterium]